MDFERFWENGIYLETAAKAFLCSDSTFNIPSRSWAVEIRCLFLIDIERSLNQNITFFTKFFLFWKKNFRFCFYLVFQGISDFCSIFYYFSLFVTFFNVILVILVLGMGNRYSGSTGTGKFRFLPFLFYYSPKIVSFG